MNRYRADSTTDEGSINLESLMSVYELEPDSASSRYSTEEGQVSSTTRYKLSNAELVLILTRLKNIADQRAERDPVALFTVLYTSLKVLAFSGPVAEDRLFGNTLYDGERELYASILTDTWLRENREGMSGQLNAETVRLYHQHIFQIPNLQNMGGRFYPGTFFSRLRDPMVFDQVLLILFSFSLMLSTSGQFYRLIHALDLELRQMFPQIEHTEQSPFVCPVPEAVVHLPTNSVKPDAVSQHFFSNYMAYSLDAIDLPPYIARAFNIYNIYIDEANQQIPMRAQIPEYLAL
ncbi:UL17-like protein [Bufonid herpesvirus 1]|uniref:UL17-like protein n=1 Tax=Bufonid herpesvirus 1 TaxID=2282206 RepID=UPI000EB63475|nr:UL17-like protein [Bufonid herpesvirus 1]AXF48636.1 UL17-like protein [Bufonid herpesvirus 1]